MAPDCLFVTCNHVPDLDPDDRVVLDELERRGVSTAVGVWSDTRVEWSWVRLCVLRSTWDYHTRYDEFIGWLDRVAGLTTVRNHPALVRWNSDKSYLSDLARHGVPIVPTVRICRGQRTSLEKIALAHGWRELVVKPSQGAAAHDVFLVQSHQAERGQAHLDRLVRFGDALVQPYLHSVATYGERALIFFEGVFSHAVCKKPFDTDLVVSNAPSTLVSADDDEVAIATSAIAVVPGTPLYARIDLLRGASGEVYVSELELVEPSLYLRVYAPARDAFADAIERELERTPSPVKS